MKVIIIYDSLFGNTEKIARSIASGISFNHEVELVGVNMIEPKRLKDFALIVFGTPTHGGMPTETMQNFLKQIPDDSLNDMEFATFDTRFLEKDQNFALRLLLKTIGYASPKMDSFLRSKGGTPVAPPEGFIVQGKKGPLAKGELERASEWAKLASIPGKSKSIKKE